MASNSLSKEGWIRGFRQAAFPSFKARANVRAGKNAELKSVHAKALQQGFTLIELMIVVAILGIISAIAYPSYVEQIIKTRRSDGKAALLETAQVLERCYTEFNAYNNAGCPAVDSGAIGGGYTTSEEGFYTISASVLTATTFTLAATPTGAQAEDLSASESNRRGIFSYSYLGVKGVSGGTLSSERCW